MNEKIYKISSAAESSLAEDTNGAVTPEILLAAVCAAMQDLAAAGFGHAYLPAGIATDSEFAIRAGYTDDDGVEVRVVGGANTLLTEVAND